jgi:CBS domain-containing protein
MRATDVMSTPVFGAAPQITVQHVARMMINHRVSGIPIVEEDGQLIGIIHRGRPAAPR